MYHMTKKPVAGERDYLNIMNNKKSQLITDALKEALYLISEEYQTLQDEEWKQKYDEVIKKLKAAIEQAKSL